MADHVWFVTGSSSGFGKSIALEALRRGHKVIATARNLASLSMLKDAGASLMEVDVTADGATLAAKLAEANNIYGKITHLVNCAGYVLEGAIEEASATEVRNIFDTNVLGTFSIVRAAAPHLRAAAAAASSASPVAIATFGSLASWSCPPGTAHYCSTKWAISGLTEGLAAELQPFGVSACVVEPGFTRTQLLKRDGTGPDRRLLTARRMSIYDETEVGRVRDMLNAANGKQPGDVDKCAVVIVDVLTRVGMAKGKEIPVRLVLGTDTLVTVGDKCHATLALLDEWGHVAKFVSPDDATA